MSLREISKFGGHGSFNMTPIIDIVFLLIIFFLVVCKFIEAENFPVAVPDSCEFASDSPDAQAGMVTVTVMKTDSAGIDFAVGSERVDGSDSSQIAGRIAKLIDARLEGLRDQSRVVTLRIDRDICFSDAQHALAGLAASRAKDIKLAALKEKRRD